MAADGEKGLWASTIDAVVKALAGAFIAAAGMMLKDNDELRAKLKETQDALEKQREVARKRGDPAERDRVRDKYKED
ncbi:MAG: hypothetical protein B7Z37_03105 [Verrucomicrobia bacterium 12-59-8]|nr:MAG: hypothetical protein B7Z37_03105 [Verrucomicrobia bacterium 12-59-8]